MLFSKKDRQKSPRARHGEENLYPVLHVADSLKEYQKELAGKEVESLGELSMVGSSFSGVMEKADHFHAQLQEFEESFSNRGRVCTGKGSDYTDGIGDAESNGRFEGYVCAGGTILRRYGAHFRSAAGCSKRDSALYGENCFYRRSDEYSCD